MLLFEPLVHTLHTCETAMQIGPFSHLLLPAAVLNHWAKSSMGSASALIGWARCSSTIRLRSARSEMAGTQISVKRLRSAGESSWKSERETGEWEMSERGKRGMREEGNERRGKHVWMVCELSKSLWSRFFPEHDEVLILSKPLLTVMHKHYRIHLCSQQRTHMGKDRSGPADWPVENCVEKCNTHTWS